MFCSNHPHIKASANIDSTWFCAPCFFHFIEARTKAAIDRHGMVMAGDRVAVGLSGGKDSSALLLILKKLAPSLHITGLVAITLDEGISGYREEAISIAESLAREAGVEHHMSRFRDVFGMDINDLAVTGRSLCSTCGVLRRRALDIAAREAGCHVIATGHTREDNAQTFLMNIIRGEPQRLARTTIRTNRMREFVPRIKPLSYLSEREVTLYAYLSDVRFQSRPCPYRTESLRLEVLTTLKKIETTYPKASVTLMRELERAHTGLMGRYQVQLKNCIKCGYPSVSEICRTCQIIR